MVHSPSVDGGTSVHCQSKEDDCRRGQHAHDDASSVQDAGPHTTSDDDDEEDSHFEDHSLPSSLATFPRDVRGFCPVTSNGSDPSRISTLAFDSFHSYHIHGRFSNN